MAQKLQILNFDISDVMLSRLGRTFATKSACTHYCKLHGFSTIARITGGNSGVFYAPYFPELLATIFPSARLA